MMMNSSGLKQTIHSDLVAPIVGLTLSGNSSSIVIHDPDGELTFMIYDSSPAQKVVHLRFSAVLRAARSRSACFVISVF
jgi:hypothetical protein